jgi:hypothetical protein
MTGGSLPYKPLLGDAGLGGPPQAPARTTTAPDAGAAAAPDAAPAAARADAGAAPAPPRPVFKSAPPAQ